MRYMLAAEPRWRARVAALLVSYMPLARCNSLKIAHSWLKSDAKPLLDTIYVDKQGSVSKSVQVQRNAAHSSLGEAAHFA